MRSWASAVKTCETQQHLQVDIYDISGDMKCIDSKYDLYYSIFIFWIIYTVYY